MLHQSPLLRAQALTAALGDLLAQFKTMLDQQVLVTPVAGTGQAELDLLKYMRHTYSVVSYRYNNLKASIQVANAANFIHALHSVNGDLTHFDFDLSKFPNSDTFRETASDIAVTAALFGRDLQDPALKAQFASELVALKSVP